MTNSQRTFPQNFLFGAATAAYQIEGAGNEDGRTDSIWDAFARVPGAVIGAENGEIACDHYHRYPQDVALMKELGLQTYRFSTSWSRVRPDAGPVNQKGVDFYSRLVDELLGADILPWLTLYHWDMPQAQEERGGWTVRETADRFTEYALTMHDALGDRVKVWTTLNEPWCSSWLSYTAGVHAPGRTSIADGLLSSHHLLLGHGQTIRELRSRDESLNLGLTLNLTLPDPVDPTNPADVDAARRIDGQFNRWFLDPVLRGAYPADVVDDIREVDAAAVQQWEEAVQADDLATISLPIDTLGVNYYHGDYVSATPSDAPPESGDAATPRDIRSPYPAADNVFNHDRGLPRTGQNWEVQPEGLTRTLNRVHNEYTGEKGIALYVTENGAAYDDEAVIEDGQTRVHDSARTEFLRSHLGATLDAIEDGADVRGFFYWSLMDNYEWAWGYAKRFGIVRVDYGTQERSFKDSAIEYRQIIGDRAISVARNTEIPAYLAQA